MYVFKHLFDGYLCDFTFITHIKIRPFSHCQTSRCHSPPNFAPYKSFNNDYGVILCVPNIPRIEVFMRKCPRAPTATLLHYELSNLNL